MWLLNVHTQQLEAFLNDRARPAYAILSHTWGDDEVTFQNYGTDHGRKLFGSKKIEFLCAQAVVDEIQWCWIDTACIDKTSSAELSEALNSMMLWYTEAEICYAYLEDVESEDGLETSRWFTRGWTLQELIAPLQVHFFGAGWKYIGSKSGLV